VRYDAIAPVYDRIMNHVEYEDWILLLEKIIKKYLKTKNNLSILELGGGTGVLGKKLKEMGFRYQGSDYSFSMARQSLNRDVQFICADARKIPFKKKFDCILFLYDGINYLSSIEEYKVLFHEIANSLTDGGVFLFDITTEYNSVRHFYDYLNFEEYSDYSVVRHSYYNEITTTQHNDFTIFKLQKNNNPLYIRYKENHEQKVLPTQLIEETVPGRLFEVLGIWDEFSMRKYSSRSERIHFLLKRRPRV
jgi:predicted TPR repeat methyltransferase